MTSRQLRTERRAAERKARKAEARAAASPTLQFVSQAEPTPQSAPSHGYSTGPRTPEGKLASSRNSLKHGLASASLIIPGEDPAEFHELRQSLLRAHAPANPAEELLVKQMAQSHWLSQRALRLQEECFAADTLDEKRLALFLRYYTTHDRAFYKALNTLMRLQKDRRKQERDSLKQSDRAVTPERQFVSQNKPASVMLDQFVSHSLENRQDQYQFVSQKRPHAATAAA